MKQLDSLKKGDIIKRFPFNSDNGPQAIFDEMQTRHINTYEVLSIDQRKNIFSLIIANHNEIAFASPVDIDRLFIAGKDLISDDVWWINP